MSILACLSISSIVLGTTYFVEPFDAIIAKMPSPA